MPVRICRERSTNADFGAGSQPVAVTSLFERKRETGLAHLIHAGSLPKLLNAQATQAFRPC